MKRFPIPALIGAGAMLWGVLLVLVWAIHPVESTGIYTPVESPTSAEQASIDEVYDEFDGARPVLTNRLQCVSNPLQVATGTGKATTAPAIEEGFEYVESPCSSAYGAARAAFWINLIVLGAIVALCVAVHLRLRNREPETSGATTNSDAKALVDRK